METVPERRLIRHRFNKPPWSGKIRKLIGKCLKLKVLHECYLESFTIDSNSLTEDDISVAATF